MVYESYLKGVEWELQDWSGEFFFGVVLKRKGALYFGLSADTAFL